MSWLDYILQQIPAVTFSGTPTNEDIMVATSSTTAGWTSEPSIKTMHVVDAASSPPRTKVGSLTGSATRVVLSAIAKAAAAASQSGRNAKIAASDATAGLSTAGAAAGGNVEIAAGSAKRLTSGNADGGSIVATVGDGIGTGVVGSFIVRTIGLVDKFVVNSDGDVTTPGAVSSASVDTGELSGTDGDFSGDLEVAGDLYFGAGATTFLRSGNGTPEGAVTAPVGSIYTRRDGGAGTVLYIKESGSGNTGWVAK